VQPDEQSETLSALVFSLNLLDIRPRSLFTYEVIFPQVQGQGQFTFEASTIVDRPTPSANVIVLGQSVLVPRAQVLCFVFDLCG